MSLGVRQFEAPDLEGLHRPGDKLQITGLLNTHGSFARTFVVDGTPVGMVGMKVRWQGVADVWAVIGDGARGHGLQLTRCARALLAQFEAELGLWRVAAMVRADNPEYSRWLRLLGFELEGVEEYALPDMGNIHRYRRLTWTDHRQLQ